MTVLTIILHLCISLQRHGLQRGRNHIRRQCTDQWAETDSTEVSSSQDYSLSSCCSQMVLVGQQNQNKYKCDDVCCCYRYLLQYQEPIPCEQLVTALCDIKQAYTQFGGTKQHHMHTEFTSWWDQICDHLYSGQIVSFNLFHMGVFGLLFHFLFFSVGLQLVNHWPSLADNNPQLTHVNKLVCAN